MVKAIAEKLSAPLLSYIGAGLTTVAASLAYFFKTEIVKIVEGASTNSTAIAIVILSLACLALLSAVFYLIPSFTYDHKLQVYRHRVTGLLYCPPCRNKRPLSPLKKEISGWRCPFKECAHFYKDPDYKKPDPPPRRPRGQNAWMS